MKGRFDNLGSSCDPRATDFMAAQISPSVNMGSNLPYLNTRVRMDLVASRPTLRTGFVWKPKTNTFRITKIIGEARKAQWVPLRHKAVGLAQNDPLKGPTNVIAQAHNSLESGLNQPTRKATEGVISSREAEVSSPADLRVEPVVELQMVTHGGCVSPVVSPVVMGAMVSPSSDGAKYEVGETSGVNHDDDSEDSELVRVDLADSESDLGSVMVVPASVGVFPEVEMLMLEDSGSVGEENPLSLVAFCSVDDRDASSPLSCSSLARIEPVECPISFTVDCGMSPNQYSQWVKKHYGGFPNGHS